MIDEPQTPPIVTLQWFLRGHLEESVRLLGSEDFGLLVRLVVRYWPRRAIARADRSGYWRRDGVERVLFARLSEEWEARRGRWQKIHRITAKAAFRLLVLQVQAGELSPESLEAMSRDMATHGVDAL